MKNLNTLFLMTVLLIPATAHADIYMKANAANGLGTTETWTSGKKQRSVTITAMVAGVMAPQVQIIRADKGVVWDMDEQLKVYQETPLAVPYEPEKEKLTAEEEIEKDKFFKQLDKGTEALDADPCSAPKKSGERVIAGMQAEGFEPACPEKGIAGTFWVAKPGEAKAAKIQAEMDAFEKAHQEAMYVLYPPQEKEEVLKLMNLIGKSMAKGLMGLPSVKNMPQRLILGMGSSGTDENNRPVSGMMYELLEAELKPANASLFEIPEGYTQVENLGELQSQQVMRRMTDGELKISDMMENVSAMGEQMGIEPIDAEPGDEENMKMMDGLGQAAAQGVQATMANQGAVQPQGNADSREALQQKFSTGQPEAWQQGLYNQQPGGTVPPQSFVQPQTNGATRQGNLQPVRRPRTSQTNSTQETLQQFNQMLQNVQNIAATFQGAGSGFQGFPGANYQTPQEEEYYDSESSYEESQEETSSEEEYVEEE